MERLSNRYWSGFWQLADPKIWIASTIPMLVASALAYSHTGNIDWQWFAIALAGIFLIEIGKNAVNEVVDYLTGVDELVTPDKRTDFSGGKKTIIDGKLTVYQTAFIALVTLVAAFCVGLFITFAREPSVFWIGMAGGILAVFYSLPPFKLNYKGLGECAVGLTFGPLMVSGMYVLMTGQLSWDIAAVGLPLAFLITNVLWINQFPDYEADLEGGKRNWLVRIGKRKGIKVYITLYTCAYISLALLAVWDNNPYWLMGFLTLPLAIQSVRTATANLNNIPLFIKANAATVTIYQLIGVTMIAAAFFT